APVRPLGVVVRVIIGVVALAAAIAILAVLISTKPRPPRIAEEERTLSVRTVEAQMLPVERVWTGYGSARALNAATISAEIAAVVEERPQSIDAGAVVSRGDLIVRLDDDEFQQRLARSRESIESLRAALRSLDVEEQSLRDSLALAVEATRLMKWEVGAAEAAGARGAAGDVELNRLRRELTAVQREEELLRKQLAQIPPRRAELEAQIAVEQASARLAEIDIERAAIAAPFGGVLQSVDVKQGERVSPGMRIARIVDLATIEIPIRLPVSAAESVRPGDRAILTPEGPVQREWEGRITRIAPEADERTRTITVFIEITQDPSSPPAELLRPGRYLTARVYDSAPHDRIVVPRVAVEDDRVMIVNGENRAQPRDVDIEAYIDARFPSVDPRETQWAVINSGLESGDRIVVSNLDEVAPGLRIIAAPARAEQTRGDAP
ncbi:MAG: efflux RND transporter periplasmic adaptor subunit, partial [Planctomycetota bacterium]|nr:efflux RND transporter periplasmic adaptor subunit [Planctomycetota bacterium]